MTEQISPQAAGAAALPAEPEQPATDGETTEEGRYIPYSGGSMGWFENSGVLKSELPNDYTFYTVMTSDRVRSKQFQRWGDRFNRRGDKRRFKRMTGVTLSLGKQRVRGTSRDVSRHGVRIQFLDEVVLEKGNVVELKMHQDEASEAVVFACSAKVVWCERVGKIRPVWNVGMTFEGLTPEQDEQLKPLLQE